MGIAHRRVGHQRSPLLPHPLGEALRAEAAQKLPGSRGARLRRRDVWRRLRRTDFDGTVRSALDLWMTIDRHVGNIRQEFCRPVLALGSVEERRRVVDEFRGVVVSLEARMGKDGL